MALKLNDGKWIYNNWFYMLIVIACLEGKGRSEYTKCMVFQAFLLKFHKDNNTRTWRAFTTDISMFDEQIGETMFAVLARSIAGGPNKSKIDQVNTAFSLIKPMLATRRAIAGDADADELGKKATFKFKEDDATVKAAVAHLKEQVRAIASGRFHHYSEEHCERHQDALANMVRPTDAKPILDMKAVLARLDKKWNGFKTQQVGDWITGSPSIQEHWPIPEPDSNEVSASEEDVATDEDEEAEEVVNYDSSAEIAPPMSKGRPVRRLVSSAKGSSSKLESKSSETEDSDSLESDEDLEPLPAKRKRCNVKRRQRSPAEQSEAERSQNSDAKKQNKRACTARQKGHTYFEAPAFFGS